MLVEDVYNKNISSQCNLTAQIEQVQDKKGLISFVALSKIEQKTKIGTSIVVI
jgi:hypothetical protein